MATDLTRKRVNVMEHSGKEFLLNLDRAERAEFYKLLDEAPWEGPTPPSRVGERAARPNGSSGPLGTEFP